MKMYNYCKLPDNEKVEVEKKYLYNSCRYSLQLKVTEIVWQLSINNIVHFHNKAIDFLRFCIVIRSQPEKSYIANPKCLCC